MPERKNLTKAVIKAIKPPAKGRIYIYDTQVPRLCLCIMASGKMSWYRYGRVKGKPQRYRIGSLADFTIDQARTECHRLNGEIADRKDPKESKRRSAAKTLGEAFAWFLEHRSKPRRKQWKKDQGDYDNHLSHWASRSLSSLTPDEIQERHKMVWKSSGPFAANQSFKLLKRIYKTAVANGWVPSNPVATLVLAPTESRERYLNPEELMRFFEAVETLQQRPRDFILICLYTGARRNNIESMRWEEIDFAAHVWTIPKAKFKTKKKAVEIVLVPQCMEILERRRAEISSEWVFPSHSSTGHYVDSKHSWNKLRKAAGLEDVRLHDLRRTLGSWQAGLGASLPIIGQSLGHRSPSATAIYARLDLNPVRASVEAAVAAMEATKKKPGK